MSSHWDWAVRVCADHDKNKPFAPENGRPLQFKVGDPVIYSNDYGVRFRFRVTRLMSPAEDALQYALGKRYFLNSSAHWMPHTEACLELDVLRTAGYGQFSPEFLAGVWDQLEHYLIQDDEALARMDAWCGFPGNL